MNISANLKNFKNRHLNSESSDFSGATAAELPSVAKKTAQTGAIVGAIGAVTGAGVGALVGRMQAIDSYERAAVPSEVELTWHQPVLREEVLGQIPKDEKLWPSLINEFGLHNKPSRINPNTEDVVRSNPDLDASGNPVIEEQFEIFKGLGEPRVNWKTHRIVSQQLTGYDRTVRSRYEGQLFCHKNWIPPSDARLERWCIDYDPVIEKQDHGTYQTPEVRFERPADVAKKITSATLSGAAKGAGIGLVSGMVLGVAGSLLSRVLADR